MLVQVYSKLLRTSVQDFWNIIKCLIISSNRVEFEGVYCFVVHCWFKCLWKYHRKINNCSSAGGIWLPYTMHLCISRCRVSTLGARNVIARVAFWWNLTMESIPKSVSASGSRCLDNGGAILTRSGTCKLELSTQTKHRSAVSAFSVHYFKMAATMVVYGDIQGEKGFFGISLPRI